MVQSSRTVPAYIIRLGLESEEHLEEKATAAIRRRREEARAVFDRTFWDSSVASGGFSFEDWERYGNRRVKIEKNYEEDDSDDDFDTWFGLYFEQPMQHEEYGNNECVEEERGEKEHNQEGHDDEEYDGEEHDGDESLLPQVNQRPKSPKKNY